MRLRPAAVVVRSRVDERDLVGSCSGFAAPRTVSTSATVRATSTSPLRAPPSFASEPPVARRRLTARLYDSADALRSLRWTLYNGASPSLEGTSPPTSSCAAAGALGLHQGVARDGRRDRGRVRRRARRVQAARRCSTRPAAGSSRGSSTRTCTWSRRSCCPTSSRASSYPSARPPSSPTRTSSRTCSAPTASTGSSTRARTSRSTSTSWPRRASRPRPFESPRRPLAAGDLESLLRRRRVLGVAEMMNYPGVIAGRRGGARRSSYPRGAAHVDGHAPGVLGRAAQRVRRGRDPLRPRGADPEEGRERLRAGMWLLIREASMARNLLALLPLVARARHESDRVLHRRPRSRGHRR